MVRIKTQIYPAKFHHVKNLSSYNHNVYSDGVTYIREQCDDDNGYYYTEVDSNDNDINYLGAENFPIFESDKEYVVLDNYFC